MRHASHADVDLAREIGVKPSRLEGWRRAGLLNPGTRRSLGRGRGTESRYSDESIAQARDLARHAGSGRGSMLKVALTMFGLGHDVAAPTMRDAYLSALDDLASQLNSTKASLTDKNDRLAEAVAMELPDDHALAAAVGIGPVAEFFEVHLDGIPPREQAYQEVMSTEVGSSIPEAITVSAAAEFAQIAPRCSAAGLRAVAENLDYPALAGIRDRLLAFAVASNPHTVSILTLYAHAAGARIDLLSDDEMEKLRTGMTSMAA